jgi:hypothetical protein
VGFPQKCYTFFTVYLNKRKGVHQMKRTALSVFSCLLVLSLLLGTWGSAKAAPGDNPIVTPISGDTSFITEIIPIASLPGVTTLSGGMLAPVGYPDGEVQFGGNGIQVTGMDRGKASACFFLSAAEINQGWGGKVGLWNGSKWVRLDTTITIPEETNNAVACATISGNGIYAFIKYVTEPDKLPLPTPVAIDPDLCSAKTRVFPVVTSSFISSGVWHPGYLNLSTGGNTLISDVKYAVGTPVIFELLSSTPSGIFAMPLVINGTISKIIAFTTYQSIPDVYVYAVTYSPSKVTYTGDIHPSLTYQVTLPNCHFTGVYLPPQ